MRVCGGIIHLWKGWEGVRSEVAGQHRTPSSRWEMATDQPLGSPGDFVGSAWRLWELDLC